MPALRCPSFYGGANRSIPLAGPPKVASRGRALIKSTASILSLNVRSSPASSGRESWGYLNPIIHNSCAFLSFAADVDDQSVLQRSYIRAVTQTPTQGRCRPMDRLDRRLRPRPRDITAWSGDRHVSGHRNDLRQPGYHANAEASPCLRVHNRWAQDARAVFALDHL